MSTLLHAACGPATLKELEWVKGATPNPDGSGNLPLFDGWTEVRLEIDAQYKPDIIGDIRDFETWRRRGNLSHGPEKYDAVFCSHALEHLHAYDVPRALNTFNAVLRPGGFVMLVVPNFEAACRYIADGERHTFYESPAGPIYAHEVVFGKEAWTFETPHQMHRTGFTPDLLRGLVMGTGFRSTHLSVDDQNILIVASKAEAGES